MLDKIRGDVSHSYSQGRHNAAWQTGWQSGTDMMDKIPADTPRDMGRLREK